MADFLWHKVSDNEREEIRKEAERIMKSFSKKLEKVKGGVKEGVQDVKEFEREEGEEDCPEIDRDTMFSNAPNKNKDFIIAERGDW